MVSFKRSLVCSVLAVLMVFSSAAIMSSNQTTDNVGSITYAGSGIGEEIAVVLMKYRMYIALLTPLPTITVYLYVYWAIGEFFFYLIVAAVFGILYYVFGFDPLGLSDPHFNPRGHPDYIN